MSIDNVVSWYEKNVNYRLTKSFLNFLIKIGIIKEDVNLELLNLFLLEYFGNEPIKENNKFKIKSNRIPIIDKFKEVKKPENVNKTVIKKGPVTITKTVTNKVSPKNKFKIEKIGGKRLKLVKLK